MIRRTRRSLPWLGAVAALLLLALPVQADDIEPEPYVEEEVALELEAEAEPYVEEEVAPELEAEPEPYVEEEVAPELEAETASAFNRNVRKYADLMIVRPFYFTRLVLGLPFFVFYPFTLLSGWGEDVVTLLWTEPYEDTFERPLGEPMGDY